VCAAAPGLLALLVLCGYSDRVPAQSESIEAIRRAPAFFALPAEVDIDRGAANGDAIILRVMPLYSFNINENWKLANLSIITMAEAPGGTPVFPGGPASGTATGVADLLHGSFFTPKRSGKLIWGIGPMLGFPTATDSALGSDKWSGGPALRVAYTAGKWNLGAVAGQRWSFAGSDNRPDVDQLLVRGAIRRPIGEHWFFVSAPLITANWNSPRKKWLVPAGGGFGRRFTVGAHPWALSFQGYHNVLKPDGAPNWIARIAVVAALPRKQ
jgi:hypothetical protein